MLGTYFARDASYAHEYTDVKLIENVTKGDEDGNGLSMMPDAAASSDGDDDDIDVNCTDVRVENMKNGNSVTEGLSVAAADDDDDSDAKRNEKTDDTKALSATDNNNNDNVDGRRQLRVMVAARVFVGRYTSGHRTYRKPPPLDPTQPHSTSFDSCVNYVDDPTLFVIFDSSQCYPEYFITYCCRSE